MSHNTLIAEIEDWLIGKALTDPDITRLFEKLSERLHAIGIPLARSVLSWPTLHPLFHAEQVFWRHGEGARLEQYYHSTAGNEQWLKSPFHHAQQNGLSRMRRRLIGTGAMLDFDVLKEFAALGFTDYLLTSTKFGIADVAEFDAAPIGMMASWATRRPDGFSDDDLEALGRIQKVMAVACRAAIQKRVMTNLATTYLGPTAGAQVLSGDIKRGDGARIPAVVWYSDLRGSTRMSDQIGADAYLALLNLYFECTAQPVIDHGGEILNFIGDGVLAIFPVKDRCPFDAAVRAEAAAREALNRCDETGCDLEPGRGELRFGIGLTVGDVMFGNIGVPGRLAFSGIGRVVNQVQRVETLTKRLGQRVLATGDFVELAPGHWDPAGQMQIDGFEGGVEVFSLDLSRPPVAKHAAGTEKRAPEAG